MQELHRRAEGFPEEKRRKVQDLTESYALTVVEEGWPLMREGRVSAKAGMISVELRRGVLDFEPRAEGEDDLYAQALTLVGELDQNRALRLLEVREGIPSILYVMLILGGATTVCFTYLLGVKAEWLHVVMIAAYTLVLASPSTPSAPSITPSTASPRSTPTPSRPPSPGWSLTGDGRSRVPCTIRLCS